MLFSLFEKSYILFLCTNKKVTSSCDKKLYKQHTKQTRRKKDVGSWNFRFR